MFTSLHADKCTQPQLLGSFEPSTKYTSNSNRAFSSLAHIFFDDAFVISDDDDTKMVINSFVKDLIVSVDKAAR